MNFTTLVWRLLAIFIFLTTLTSLFILPGLWVRLILAGLALLELVIFFWIISLQKHQPTKDVH